LVRESNSPIYTPLTIINLTEVVQLARNREARQVAGECLERLWADLLDYCHFATRTVRLSHGESCLEMAYGLESDGARYACVNGRLLARPAWEATGLAAERLPFLGRGRAAVSGDFPHRHLRVNWASDSPWVITQKTRGTAARVMERGGEKPRWKARDNAERQSLWIV